MGDASGNDAILVIEPFYGGSHKQFIDAFQWYYAQSSTKRAIDLHVLPAKKWHWRARTSALHFAETVPTNSGYSILFCSSVLNLTELVGLRPDLSRLFKVIYFHENQLVIPVRERKDRDFQYGYNQILSALSADLVIFNSQFNMMSFVDNVQSHFKLQPDFRPKNLREKILSKSKVIYFPLFMPDPNVVSVKPNVVHIVWPHRWEHDKNPEVFFQVLMKLKEDDHKFFVSVLGESFSEIPVIFAVAQKELGDRIINWGWIKSKDDYYACLRSCHVVVSTALHEFFGVAMLECVMYGCFPLACNRLVYPEIFPKLCLYNTSQQLYKKLKMFCNKPHLCQIHLREANIDLNRFDVNHVMQQLDYVFTGKSVNNE